ncbi:hypothetical protein CCMA1212_009031 [Trichoderma ghanense]|uniref:Uncharacterized protein n=1 Tax=Trichoderma ghanense TaxID=65468 RepID=A0ABY2GTZ8_9HYPO
MLMWRLSPWSPSRLGSRDRHLATRETDPTTHALLLPVLFNGSSRGTLRKGLEGNEEPRTPQPCLRRGRGASSLVRESLSCCTVPPWSPTIDLFLLRPCQDHVAPYAVNAPRGLW